jgi:hypothetical protein
MKETELTGCNNAGLGARPPSPVHAVEAHTQLRPVNATQVAWIEHKLHEL